MLLSIPFPLPSTVVAARLLAPIPHNHMIQSYLSRFLFENCRLHDGVWCSSLAVKELYVSAVRILCSRRTEGKAMATSEEVVECKDASGSDAVPDTEGIGEGVEDQLTPHDLWVWNSQTHWKHWHGLWTMYQPLETSQIVKAYKSVRSLWPVDEDRVCLYHRNQWYADSGEGKDMNWENGPWAMHESKHSLPDGIWHPNSIDHRILQFPNGDLGWVQLALKLGDPKCVVFNEVHFMASPQARMPVIIGYDSQGKLGVALQLEETRDSDKWPESSWQGTIWKHHQTPLAASCKEPEGYFVGTEMSITTTLLRTTQKACWKGFRGGLREETAKDYVLIHLPYNVTACAPSKAAVGKAHSFYVSWVVNEDQVRVLSVRYFADGKLQNLKSGTYYRC
eukprot:c19884_g1_i1 orf=67-1245(+)